MSVSEVEEKLKLQRAALADFGLFAFQCDDIDDLLGRACELVSSALDIHLVKVLEHLPERGEMLIRAGVNWKPGVVGRETFEDDEHSPGGYALRAAQPVVSPDLDLEERFETPAVLRHHGVRSMVNVIIAGEGEAFGVLEVDAREPRDFGDDDVAFLRTYANLLAAGIDRVRTHDELRRSALDHELLARELGHRVRNLLGLVRALASQTTSKDGSEEGFRSAFIARLHALATAEGLVFERSENHTDPMILAQEILEPHRHESPEKITIDGPPVQMSARQARMFGLALHELATNAAKYGALSVSGGVVHLAWRLDETAADRQRLVISWEEADGPEITPPERKGFGTRLLEDVVGHALDGEAELNYEPQGLRYYLKIPLDG